MPDPIFLGGPFGVDVMFALVQSHDSPGGDALQVAPDLYLAVAADTVDHIIETGAEHARFLVGMVVWRPGELHEEMRRGLWYEMKTEQAPVTCAGACFVPHSKQSCHAGNVQPVMLRG